MGFSIFELNLFWREKGHYLKSFFPLFLLSQKGKKGRKGASEVQYLWQNHCLITDCCNPLVGGEIWGGEVSCIALQITLCLEFIPAPHLDPLCSSVSKPWAHVLWGRSKAVCVCCFAAGVPWLSLKVGFSWICWVLANNCRMGASIWKASLWQMDSALQSSH